MIESVKQLVTTCVPNVMYVQLLKRYYPTHILGVHFWRYLKYVKLFPEGNGSRPVCNRVWKHTLHTMRNWLLVYLPLWKNRTSSVGMIIPFPSFPTEYNWMGIHHPVMVQSPTNHGKPLSTAPAQRRSLQDSAAGSQFWGVPSQWWWPGWRPRRSVRKDPQWPHKHQKDGGNSLEIMAGWWYTYPSEKYESQLGWWTSQDMEKWKMFQTTNQMG